MALGPPSVCLSVSDEQLRRKVAATLQHLQGRLNVEIGRLFDELSQTVLAELNMPTLSDLRCENTALRQQLTGDGQALAVQLAEQLQRIGDLGGENERLRSQLAAADDALVSLLQTSQSSTPEVAEKRKGSKAKAAEKPKEAEGVEGKGSGEAEGGGGVDGEAAGGG
eukprot:gnl/TRDRNA2_/TRDRNA2_149756_c0_seq1.p2 gnl/TRDRNA2_/TRDRNA2_149756_c0~~gnl/TRDRNA2_/TRDRNA2_149756_c0_seq1.p2  ORF type:complete len:176 (+),score=43.33 gnl/TRDRNA2_/TRDRNA2_149756_c0_seq1:28-528(+)